MFRNLKTLLLANDVELNPGPPATENVDLASAIFESNCTPISLKTKGLKLAHLNIRSILGKIDQLRLYMINKPFDILSISESWLNTDILDGEVDIPGYSCVRRDRRLRRGGGLITYIKEDLNFECRQDLDITDSEILWIEINRSKCKPLIIGCVYRPPDQSENDFLAGMEEPLSKIDFPNYEKALLGDFNIDFGDKPTSRNRQSKKKFERFFSSFGFDQLILEPTRISNHSRSTIDLIFVNNKHRITTSGVIHLGLSDHSLVYCVMKSGMPKAAPRVIEYRSFKTYDKNNFTKDLSQVPWSVIYATQDANDAVDLWSKLFIDVANQHAPIKTRRVRGLSAPWMTTELSKLMNDRDYQHRKARNTNSERFWVAFRKINRKVHLSIKKAKSDYYMKLIEENKGNCSKLWNSIKEVLPTKSTDPITSIQNNNIVYTTPREIVKVFNDFFTNIGKLLSQKFLSPRSVFAHLPQVESSFCFMEVSQDFVKSQLNQLKTNKPAGIDKINARMIKDAADTITPSLTSLLNMLIKESIFPLIWKTGKITALFKAGVKTDTSNYRPISILPILSKIFEKVIHNQLYQYLNQHKLLSTAQFGFKPKSSTCVAVSSFTDEMLKNLDKGHLTGLIFLDLSKAFDSVDHSMLLDKLSSLGVRNSELDLFRSYLTNRRQCTCYNNYQSDLADVQFGVPQGSILGPLLFLIYLNDLPNSVDHANITLYADDIALCYSDKDTLIIQDILNRDLSNICNWLERNHLTLNANKSKFMMIGSPQKMKTLQSVTISVGTETLKQSTSFKYLGVTINSHLTWNDHIDKICSNVLKKLSLFRRVKAYLPLHARKLFYFSYILPHFDYCDIIWGDRGNISQMDSLQVLQNRIAKELLDRTYFSSATDALQQLSWKPLDVRRKFHRCIFMHKCLNKAIDYDFDITLNMNIHNHNTRNKLDIRKPKAKRRWGHWTVVSRASEDWNEIDMAIRCTDDFNVFKRKLSNIM